MKSIGRNGVWARTSRWGVRAVICLCVGSVSAAETAQKTPAPPTHRFYGGVALQDLGFDDQYAGIRVSDTSLGIALYGGAYLKERLSLELSYDSVDAIDLHDIAGSGVVRFDIKTRRSTETLSVVREVSLRDVFGFRRDWRVYGTAGLYRSDLSRSVTLLNAGTATQAPGEVSGLTIGAGVLYRVGGVDLRGYVRQFGATGDREGREAGLGVQRRF
ncbi:MAG TPA: outer membrane beta-barrel protein [Gammaproteobacteria bacterium]|jgi:hypothetical protein|nr:outer membrane beta-barrel protein [Gammaproteobacteria bacterium]